MQSKPITVTSISVEHFYAAHNQQLRLSLIAGATGLNRKIREATVNRPGLALAGFFRHFAWKRVQVIGNSETAYVKSLSSADRRKRIRDVFSRSIPCVVLARNIQPTYEAVEEAESLHLPIFRSPLVTGRLINLATLLLDMDFAPRITEHGTMVDILGIGVLIKGQSGVGKSECALSLVERGYSLVSDDITRIYVLDGRELMAASDPQTRYHMEVRGLGIINIAAVFGAGAVRNEKRVDLVVTLKDWNAVSDIERVGMDRDSCRILGIEVPHVTVPVRPGRDIARLVEVAALDQKLRGMGHNVAKEFNDRLIARMRKDGQR